MTSSWLGVGAAAGCWQMCVCVCASDRAVRRDARSPERSFLFLAAMPGASMFALELGCCCCRVPLKGVVVARCPRCTRWSLDTAGRALPSFGIWHPQRGAECQDGMNS